MSSAAYMDRYEAHKMAVNSMSGVSIPRDRPDLAIAQAQVFALLAVAEQLNSIAKVIEGRS